jgi:hypothetical protein
VSLSQEDYNTPPDRENVPRKDDEKLNNTVSWIAAACVVFLGPTTAMGQEVRVPAHTAYILPDSNGVRVSEKNGIDGWQDSSQTVNWYGKIDKSGMLRVRVEVAVKENVQARLRMTLDDVSREVEVQGLGLKESLQADFGEFEIAKPGYKRFQLESLHGPAAFPGKCMTMLLDGPAAERAHFNLKERRNAASVHLMYPTQSNLDVEAFYCEVTAIEDPTATFYMACGWHRGYFGMQVNSPTERRIIFSVWDSGNEAVDRNKVDKENRVQLLGKGTGVVANDFGNEGTGGHSHLKYLWKTGQVQRFVVTAQPVEKTFTIFSGYWWHPDQKAWMLISSWKAPKEGGWLRGLHSFSENFDGSNGQLLRKAMYGNQWIRSSSGEWTELTTAKFSHDPTGKSDRLDRFMGVERDSFFLSHGGYVEGFTAYGEKFERKALGSKPDITSLPAIP